MKNQKKCQSGKSECQGAIDIAMIVSATPSGGMDLGNEVLLAAGLGWS